MYDLTIIIPFFHKIEEFRSSLKINSSQFEKALEVLVLVDHKINTRSLNYTKKYKNINFTFHINSENHPWRNPSVPINYGIKKAKGKYIMIISPESIFINNVVDILYHNCVKHKNIFTYGNITFTSNAYYKSHSMEPLFDKKTNVTEDYIGPIGYGSICCSKNNLKKVDYYNEDFVLWGGEDDNIRIKLINKDIQGKHIKKSKMIHLETKTELNQRINRMQNKNNIKNILNSYSIDEIKQILNNNNIPPPKTKNREELYNYLYNLYLKGSLMSFKINNFNKYQNFNLESRLSNNICSFFNKKKKRKLENLILNSDENFLECEIGKKFKNTYKIMLLTPCYNEEKNIVSFLENNKDLVDGCIILDDNSTDKIWKKIKSKYVSVKIRKKREKVWNDLENRNMLLDVLNIFLKSCIKVDWVLWLDCDEMVGNNNIGLLKQNILSSKNNVLDLPFYHMWNNTHYNMEYPNRISNKSKLQQILNSKYQTTNYYTRMFKIKEDYFHHQISHDKKLHFSLLPDIYKKEKFGFTDLQILHNSTDCKEKRIKKYTKYQENDLDNSQNNYKHILVDNPIINRFKPIY